MRKIFLEAEWRKLIMANYAVDKKMLEKYLPHKTELDLWNNTCYLSLVGFLFMNTSVKGIRIPFHSTFEEVNLRFYVRYNAGGTWKRGVVFIKEIVPKAAITFVANTVYHEPYETMPMQHMWHTDDTNLTITYKWKKKRWHSMQVLAELHAQPIAENSEEEFITEHYWGYTKMSDTQTAEYGVEHPRWEVYPVKNYWINVDFATIYGPDFRFLQDVKPKSVFLAEGSKIKVRTGRKV
jgi:hypothetical protein